MSTATKDHINVGLRVPKLCPPPGVTPAHNTRAAAAAAAGAPRAKRLRSYEELRAWGKGCSDEEEVETEDEAFLNESIFAHREQKPEVGNALPQLAPADKAFLDRLEDLGSDSEESVTSTGTVKYKLHDSRYTPLALTPLEEQLWNSAPFQAKMAEYADIEHLRWELTNIIENGVFDFHPVHRWPSNLREHIYNPRATRTDRWALFIFLVFNGVDPYVAVSWIQFWHDYDVEKRYVNVGSDIRKHCRELVDDFFKKNPKMFSARYYDMWEKKMMTGFTDE